MEYRLEHHQEAARILEKAAPLTGFPGRGWDVYPLQADGSDRRFYRVRRGENHFVVLASPRRAGAGMVDENDSYLRIGRHLHDASLPVPRIIWADTSQGQFLMQDVGDEHLQRAALERSPDLHGLYLNAVRLLARLHKDAPRGFERSFCFDSVLYDPAFIIERELEYFRNAFLVGYVGLDAAGEDLRADFEAIAEAAGVREPAAVMHRDFQSRNLMVHQGGLWILDFQGMRFGPSAYDLASLLLDPYVMLPAAWQVELAELYWSEAKAVFNSSYERFRSEYEPVRLCRNLQVLGAYGFLGKVRGKRHFLRYIPGAWLHLREWLRGPCHGRYPQLERWVDRADGVLQKAHREMMQGETFT